MNSYRKALLLAVALMASILLMSCGGKGNSDKGYNTPGNGEYAYKSEFAATDIKLEGESLLIGDKIYYSTYEYIDPSNLGGEGGIDASPMPLPRATKADVEALTDEIGAIEEAYEQELAVSENEKKINAEAAVVETAADNATDDLSEPEPVPDIDSGAFYDDRNQGYSLCRLFVYDINTKQNQEITYELPKNLRIGRILVDAKNNIYLTTDFYKESEDGYGQSISGLIKLNADFEEVYNINLSELSKSEYFYVGSCVVDNKGNFYYTYDANAVRIDPAGKLTGNIELTLAEGEYLGQLVISGTDTVYLQKQRYTQTSNSSKTENFFAKADFDAGSAGSDILIDAQDFWISNMTPISGEDAFFANVATAFVKIIPATGKLETQFLWVNADINADTIRSVYAQDNDNYKAVLVDYMRDDDVFKAEVANITKVKASEMPKKTIITYGLPNGYINYQNEILAFNRQNNDYRIEVVAYKNENQEENLKRLSMDLASGNAPDIIEWSVEADYMQFGAKGTLADIAPLLDADGEIKRQDFLPGVIESQEKDGKIYALPNSIQLMTLLAAKDAPNVKEGWNIDEFINYVKSRQSKVPVMNMAKSDAIYQFTANAYSTFVDWNSGDCYFDTPLYIGMLELSNTFPEISNDNYEDFASLYQQGQMLFYGGLNSLNDLEYWKSDSFKGKEFINVGFPANDDTNGTLIMMGDIPLVISAKSKNIDGAWQFLRTRYKTEAQTGNNLWRFPSNKAAFDIQTDKYFKEVENRKSNGDTNSAFSTQADADWVKSLIANARPQQVVPLEIQNIIKEEALKYFNGQITSENAAKNIQNRVKLYVDENR